GCLHWQFVRASWRNRGFASGDADSMGDGLWRLVACVNRHTERPRLDLRAHHELCRLVALSRRIWLGDRVPVVLRPCAPPRLCARLLHFLAHAAAGDGGVERVRTQALAPDCARRRGFGCGRPVALAAGAPRLSLVPAPALLLAQI